MALNNFIFCFDKGIFAELLFFCKQQNLLTRKNLKTMKLKFEHDHFVIHDDSGKHSRLLDLKGAAKYKRFADLKALKVLNRSLVRFYDAPALSPFKFLDAHQVDGVRWILSRSRSYLAHAPGAGKTLQAIVAAFLTKGPGTILFIVPPSLTANWVREIERFSQDLKWWPSIAVVPGSSKLNLMDWAADIIVCPDSMITDFAVLMNLQLIKKKFVAVDEASRFKELESSRTRALFGGMVSEGIKSVGLIYDCKHTVLLDGSPMPNRPMELWAPTLAMNPEAIDFMTQMEFGLRYCGAKTNERGQWEFKHSSNEDELRERLQKDFMHVVKEEQLGHAERLRSIIVMNDDPRTLREKSFEQKWLSNIRLENLDEKANRGDIATYRCELGIKKIPWVAKRVRELLDKGNESILLFAWHREVVLGLAKELKKYKPGVVMGGTKSEDREKSFSDFQRGDNRLVIGNIVSSGRGHNLQRADRVIFAEYSWTDELNRQCEKRASRRGRDRDKSVRCEYVVVPASIDEIVLSAVFRKARSVKRIVG